MEDNPEESFPSDVPSTYVPNPFEVSFCYLHRDNFICTIILVIDIYVISMRSLLKKIESDIKKDFEH